MGSFRKKWPRFSIKFFIFFVLCSIRVSSGLGPLYLIFLGDSGTGTIQLAPPPPPRSNIYFFFSLLQNDLYTRHMHYVPILHASSTNYPQLGGGGGVWRVKAVGVQKGSKFNKKINLLRNHQHTKGYCI